MTTTPATPCSIPECNADGTGEPCDRHETEQAHSAGEHEFCGVTCETEFPSDVMRNTILCRAIPGSKSMLAELERRAAVPLSPLSESERKFLSWALDQAANELQLGDGGNDEDWSAIVALRKLAVGVTS